MSRSLRMAGAALVLGVLALGSTGASAHGFGFGHGGFGHVGFGHGGFGHGIHFGGGWGHGWGWGHRWGGWGYRGIAYRPFVGGCYYQRFVDIYSNISVRRVCY